MGDLAYSLEPVLSRSCLCGAVVLLEGVNKWAVSIWIFLLTHLISSECKCLVCLWLGSAELEPCV